MNNPILARRILRAWAETPGIDTGAILGGQLAILSDIAAREATAPGGGSEDMTRAQTAAFAGMVAILFAVAAWIMAWAWRVGGHVPLAFLVACVGVWGMSYMVGSPVFRQDGAP